MARELGRTLPADLAQELTRESPRANAVPIVTIDSEGFPHVALLSYFEIFYLGNALYFFIGSPSRTANNLHRRHQCTLLFVHRDFVYYIKSRAARVGGERMQSIYKLTIEMVLEDFPSAGEGDVLLETGIRIQASEEDRQERQALREQILESLTHPRPA